VAGDGLADALGSDGLITDACDLGSRQRQDAKQKKRKGRRSQRRKEAGNSARCAHGIEPSSIGQTTAGDGQGLISY
jgi:hypothetical protein